MSDMLSALKAVTETACSDGNWNANEYLHGMANGLILALAIMEQHEPVYLDAPKQYVCHRQTDVLKWAADMFGPVAGNVDERCARFIEESAELVHALGLSRVVINRILARVYSRPAGDPARETGQAQITLEALAENIGVNVENEARAEFNRIRAIPREEWQRRHAAKAEQRIADLGVTERC